MPNTWFQFKQFRVSQARSAMKVTTDACLFGAWSGSQLETSGKKRILDIGTGTGLLSLMLAQSRPFAEIVAVELDLEAFSEARENVFQSPWANQITVYHSSIQDFSGSNPGAFDVIICNPPFFARNLKSPDAQKNQAIHNETLSFSELAQAIASLQRATGNAFILYPEWEMAQFLNAAKPLGLSAERITLVRNTAGEKPLRVMAKMVKNNIGTPVSNEILIRDYTRNYSPAFVDLLKPFYLYL